MSKELYLVATPFFPSPETWRGAYCYDFVRALMRTDRYDVRVFVPGRGADYDYQGVHVYRFPVKALPSAVLPLLFAGYNRRSFLRKVAAVGVDLAQVAVCHGHTATFGIYPLALKAKNPRCLTLLHHHDPASFGLHNGRLKFIWLHKVINFLQLRRIHEAIDLHVFISEVVRKSFLAVPDASWTVYEERKRELRGLGLFRGVRMKAGVVLHNGVETRIFHPQPESRAGEFVIGCIANFSKGKDQLTLLKAARLISYGIDCLICACALLGVVRIFPLVRLLSMSVVWLIMSRLRLKLIIHSCQTFIAVLIFLSCPPTLRGLDVSSPKRGLAEHPLSHARDREWMTSFLNQSVICGFVIQWIRKT